jgi:hypothetical protein
MSARTGKGQAAAREDDAAPSGGSLTVLQPVKFGGRCYGVGQPIVIDDAAQAQQMIDAGLVGDKPAEPEKAEGDQAEGEA